MAGTGTVSILFTDLADSTAQEAAAGSEAWDRIRDAHFTTLREAVKRHDGEVVKTIGDAIMAVFTSAINATAAAVAMQQGVATANRRDGRDLGLRIGISAGDAVEQDSDWFGLPVVEASRLCTVAHPGQIVVADIVRHLGRGRVTGSFESLGALTLKGIPEPVPASEIVWHEAANPVALPARLTGGVRSPFVGRRESRDALRKLWDAEVTEGRPSVVLVAGEPGIGKTRLAAELARAVHAEGATVLFGRCDEDLVVPYRPFVEALRQYVAAIPADELPTRLGAGARDLARLMPELRELIPGLAEPTRSDPESERLAVFEAVGDVLCRAAGVAPILVLLDDIHWADQQTLYLLRHLAREAERSRLLIVGTYRDTELGRTHPLAETLADLRRERLVERIALRGLAAEDVAEMASAWAGSSAPAALIAAVHDETEGNPFFVEEVLAHLAETGVVRAGDEGWADVSIAQLGIPEGIREVVGRRLSRLPDEVVEILSVGAVVGREFSIDILERCGVASSDAILHAVELATRAGLAREVPGAMGHFSFSHALVRQTLYDELSTVRRTRLHWTVGEALEGIDVGAAAFHLLGGALAGDVERAVRAAIRAADAASSKLALDEAIAWYERALTLLDQIGCDDTLLRYDVTFGLGAANNNGGWPEDSWRHFRTAIVVARALGDHARLVDAVTGFATFVRFGYDAELDDLLAEALDLVPAGAAELRLRLRAVAAMHHVMWFGRSSYQDEIDAVVAEAEAGGDGPTLVSAYETAAAACLGSPRVERGLLELQKMERVLGPDSPWVLRDVRLILRRTFVMALGDRAAVDAIAAEVGQLSRRRGPLRAYHLTLTNAVALLEGRFDDAKAGAVELRSIVSRTGVIDSDMTTQAQITAARMEQGRGSQIVEELTSVVDAIPTLVGWRAMAASLLAEAGELEHARRRVDAVRAEGVRDDWNQGLCLRWLGEAATHLEDVDLARELEPIIRPYSGQLWVAPNLVLVHGAADRTLGQMEMVQGRLDDAVSHFEAAAELERKIRGRALVARTELWLARALVARRADGDRVRASEVAQRVVDEAAAMGMALVEQQARDVLSSLT